MLEKLKYIGKLSAIAAFSFLKIYLLGIISTIAVCIIDYILLSKNIRAGHVSASAFLHLIFSTRPIGTIWWFLSIAVAPFLYFIYGKKYILSKITHKVISDKAESLLHPILDKIIAKIKAKRPDKEKNIVDFTHEKTEFIQELKSDKSENKWLKKMLILGLKKTKLEGIDNSKKNLDIYELIKNKVIWSLKEMTEPSRSSIWMIFGLQWLGVLFIWLIGY